jgi:hypothetical protein
VVEIRLGLIIVGIWTMRSYFSFADLLAAISLFSWTYVAGAVVGITSGKSRMNSLVIGLNPALQRTVSISGLTAGAVNRGTSVRVGIGGKGQDVVVAAASMKANPMPQLLQFLGQGAEGDALAGLLNHLGVAASSNLSIRTTAPCRTCM